MKLAGIGLLILLLAAPACGEDVAAPGGREGRLHADHVRYDARSRIFTADGNVVLSLEDVEVHAPQITFDLPSHMMRAAGGVTVTQKDVTVTTPRLTYDARTQDAVAEEGVRLVQPGRLLTADAMTANLQRKEADMTGHVVLRTSGPRRSAGDAVPQAPDQSAATITAPRVIYRWDAREAKAEGGVVIAQPDKTMRSGQALYAEADGRIVLEGDVVMEQSNGEWLVRHGVVGLPQDPESRKALASPATLSCDRLVILLADGDMDADGHVTVVQEGRSIAGEHASYSAKDRRVIMAGDVHVRDADGSALRADQVVILLAQGTFEATGNVDADLPAHPKK
jgi:lipopolysaccharide assembly outer membrane protein LptD (OstA)